MPFNLGMGEVIVILIVALLVFGGRLPEVGRSLGRGIVEFKEGLKGKTLPDEAADEEADDEAGKEEPDAADPEVEGVPGGNGKSA